ncbi:MAG: 1,4-alpha-glucan branching protein GlgB [Verrucomicrobiota bacterium]
MAAKRLASLFESAFDCTVLLSQSDLESITKVACTQPHGILGMHPVRKKGDSGIVVRAYVNDAVTCEVVDLRNPDDQRYPMDRLSKDGFFEVFIQDQSDVFPYRLRIERYNGEIRQFYDPYSYLPTLSEEEVYLFNEGNEHFIHNKLGAHIRTIDGVPGVSFAVWAPNAIRVSVVGDFNYWDGRYHPMRSLGASGIWELFVPGLGEGTKYKFEIGTRHGYPHLKTDPYGTRFEAPPYNASIVCKLEDYQWNDDEWIKRREATDWNAVPLSVYEMHVGSWKRVVEDANRPLTYRELAVELVDYLKKMGYTHVEFMPLSEHPFDGSWGYQVTGFFAPTHRFGSPQDFMYLVDVLHQNGFGVIMDWVPAHFPTDSFALAQFDGTALYEHADPRQGFHQDWGTLIFNYGRNEVRAFLIASALAWCEHYHIDGLRVDAVASMLYLDYSREEGQWVPNQYGGRENLEAIDLIRKTNDLVHEYYPGTLMIAEESTAFPGVSKPTSDGGLGFDLKWNMGWMHDTLLYMQKDPVHRKYVHHMLSFGMLYQYSENFTQVFSHDEVVHGKRSMLLKMPGEPISRKANELRALYGLMWMWPGKKTLFMGSDFGQSSEWRYNGSLDWHLLQYGDHQGIQAIVADLNRIYHEIPGLAVLDNRPEGFEWINCTDNQSSVMTFIRNGNEKNDTLVIVGHFTPVPRKGYRVGVPYPGYWKEILNTDAKDYGGLGYGNKGGVQSDAEEWDGRKHSIKIDLPPSSVTVFRYQN